MRGGNRTETIQDLNANGSERDSTVKVTSADGSSKTIQYDHAGTGTVDLTQISTIVRNADGSSVTTQTDLNGDKSLRDETVTTLSADGLSKTTQYDNAGSGTFDLATTDVTVYKRTAARPRPSLIAMRMVRCSTRPQPGAVPTASRARSRPTPPAMAKWTMSRPSWSIPTVRRRTR